jgi:reactive intermediate/imine deaminase
MRNRMTALLGACLLGACAPPASAPDVEYVPLPGGRSLPFSAAVRVGSMLYLSGQIGTDETGRLVSGGIEAETRQTLDNIRGVLEANGSSLDRVVKCTVMLADIGEWEAMNRVYVGYFPRILPARSAFGASGLALGARIEIECWAAVGPGRARARL